MFCAPMMVCIVDNSSASRGEASPRHPENFFRTTTWCLMTPMNSHNTVESCLEALAVIIDGRQDKFLNLQDAEVHMHVSVMQSVWTDEIFFEISPKVLQFFASYRLPLCFYSIHKDTVPSDSWLRRTGKKPYG
jgi:hypothetical protein